MTREEFIALFPRKGIITQEIIDTARLWSVSECIGAKTLKASLGEEIVKELCPNMWGNETGCITDKQQQWLSAVEIGTKENIPMIDVDIPMEVEFIVTD
jgi:hypothetical protein